MGIGSLLRAFNIYGPFRVLLIESILGTWLESMHLQKLTENMISTGCYFSQWQVTVTSACITRPQKGGP